MIHSNIEYCEQNEDDEMLYKYKDVFASVFNKHRVYAATFRNLQKKHRVSRKTYQQVDVEDFFFCNTPNKKCC